MKPKCLYCNKNIIKRSYDSASYYPKRKYCDAECMKQAFKGKHFAKDTEFKAIGKIGEKNPTWRGGRYISHGYAYVWVGKKTYVLEHRYIMEKKLGRKLNTNEHVHHINHNKSDNRLENLIVLTAEEHGRYHAVKYWHGKPVGGF